MSIPWKNFPFLRHGSKKNHFLPQIFLTFTNWFSSSSCKNWSNEREWDFFEKKLAVCLLTWHVKALRTYTFSFSWFSSSDSFQICFWFWSYSFCCSDSRGWSTVCSQWQWESRWWWIGRLRLIESRLKKFPERKCRFWFFRDECIRHAWNWREKFAQSIEV